MSRARIQPHPKLPDEVSVEETVEGVRYVLPVRLLGSGHLFGAVVAVAGIVVFVAGLWWGAAVLLNGPLGGFALLASMILPLMLVAIGLVLWTSGLFLTNGSTEIELRGSRLYRIERAGILRWTRRTPIARLSKLRIEVGVTSDETIDEAIAARTVSGPLSWLAAEYENGNSVKLLVAYPQQWVESIAYDLSERLALHPAAALPGAAASRPDVVVGEYQRDAGARRRSDEDVAQPVDSAIEIERSREGLTISIPPLSLWRKRGGAMSMGAAMNGFMAVLTGGAFGFMSAPWYVNLSIGAFWALGMLVMLVAVSIGRRTAIVDVFDGSSPHGTEPGVLITQKSLLGVKQRHWTREQIRTIECAASGMEVNEQPVMQLQITPASGGTASFFTGRDEAELRWLARLLRDTLQLPEDDDDETTEQGQ